MNQIDMKTAFYFTFLFILSLNFACTEAIPGFSDGESTNIPQPTFSGKTDHSQKVLSSVTPIAVQGECDPRTQSLQMKIDGFKGWSSVSDLSTSSVLVDCKNGKFQFTLMSLGEMGVWDTSKKFNFKLEARSVTTAGYSKAGALTLLYDPPGKSQPPGSAVTAGGREVSSTSFQLRGRIREQSGGVVTSPSFKVRSGLSATKQ